MCNRWWIIHGESKRLANANEPFACQPTFPSPLPPPQLGHNFFRLNGFCITLPTAHPAAPILVAGLFLLEVKGEGNTVWEAPSLGQQPYMREVVPATLGGCSILVTQEAGSSSSLPPIYKSVCSSACCHEYAKVIANLGVLNAYLTQLSNGTRVCQKLTPILRRQAANHDEILCNWGLSLSWNTWVIGDGRETTEDGCYLSLLAWVYQMRWSRTPTWWRSSDDEYTSAMNTQNLF